MRLLVTAEEARELTNKVLAAGEWTPKPAPGTPAVRLASLPAALLGRLCGFEELRVEVERPRPTIVEHPPYETWV